MGERTTLETACDHLPITLEHYAGNATFCIGRACLYLIAHALHGLGTVVANTTTTNHQCRCGYFGVELPIEPQDRRLHPIAERIDGSNF